jgi:hypothetical protein
VELLFISNNTNPEKVMRTKNMIKTAGIAAFALTCLMTSALSAEEGKVAQDPAAKAQKMEADKKAKEQLQKERAQLQKQRSDEAVLRYLLSADDDQLKKYQETLNRVSKLSDEERKQELRQLNEQTRERLRAEKEARDAKAAQEQKDGNK